MAEETGPSGEAPGPEQMRHCDVGPRSREGPETMVLEPWEAPLLPGQAAVCGLGGRVDTGETGPLLCSWDNPVPTQACAEASGSLPLEHESPQALA